MQLGFVIDQTRCIGCHACTVACKAENDVPLGDFRTWVKYTEEGTFPQVRRSFSVLRCNQCTHAPCVTICPVNALEKRPDGIVDVDPKACVGCKACMQGCPYDALYLNESTGTAEKCHFCAHRTERGLAPACAVVCPTEAIIPGDFDDPESRVSRMRAEGGLAARKTEAGTGPNVHYRGASRTGLDPLLTSSAGGYLWSQAPPGPSDSPGGPGPGAAAGLALMPGPTEARTTYDVPRAPLWGGKITGYLFAKSLAAGALLAPILATWMERGGAPAVGPDAAVGAGALASVGLLFLTLTCVLLVADLKRPERFWFLLARGNPDSWLVRGTWILTAYGALLALLLAIGLGDLRPGALLSRALEAALLVTAFLSAAYTGWLFGQSKGRVLWMRRGLWLHLGVHALVAGAALWILAAPLFGFDERFAAALAPPLLLSLSLSLGFALTESRMAPKGRAREYARAHALLTAGPFRRRRLAALILGLFLPIALLVPAESAHLARIAAALALLGLWLDEDVLVRAGQALPIS